jgi:hypothetical protein
MWRSLLEGYGWSRLSELVSPAFFEVLRPADLQRQIRELGANYVRRGRFRVVRDRLARGLTCAGSPVRLGPAPRGVELEAGTRGALVLQLFFYQLFADGTAALDLRHARFRGCDPLLYWQPRPWFVNWDAGFLAALRDVYRGFYDDEPPRLRNGMNRLGIGRAEDILAAHFRPNQRAMRFRLREFRSSFHDAFLRCRDAGIALHRNFLPLGIYLACLYEHLERLGGTHDVVAAFRAARPAAAMHPVPTGDTRSG